MIDSEEAGGWNMPQADQWERHTVDIDRRPMSFQAPEKSKGAIWAWVAMGAVVGLYLVWRHWPK